MLDFYINFVKDLNPGRMYRISSYLVLFKMFVLKSNLSLLALWPQYKPDTKLVLQLQRDNITALTDGRSSRGFSEAEPCVLRIPA